MVWCRRLRSHLVHHKQCNNLETQMKNILDIDSVILEFGLQRILQNVYLKSESGRITGLLGRNGTGKSSLMKISFGELNPTNKSIRINNKALIGSKRNPNEIRYLTLEDHLNQEIFVAVKSMNKIEEEGNNDRLQSFYIENKTSEEYSLIFNFFYGNKGSESLGYKTFGNSTLNGYA